MRKDAGSDSVARQLQQLILESGNVELFLEAFASHTATILEPGVQTQCGITLKRNDRATTVASSSVAATELDEVQYGYGDGPCLTAIRTGETAVVQDTRTDPRWPEYLTAIEGRGYFSVLGVPLMTGGDGGAAVNLYAEAPGVFTADIVSQVEEYAAEAASTLELALQLAAHKDAAANLQAAMESRTNIDIAVGIIIAQNRCTQQEAIQILRRASSHQNVKLRVLAEQLVQSVATAPATTHFTN
ncbi:GAF and ANTAR domain-containing protein [Arthrobacter zhaoguopingii]|uniref:GAF and ANTAR domain-containing protein n=1 Tax=Arthrobacter zhaoguopingii TaxID=2681491 RepID=UPI0013594A1C|nr:GAF and ANTAR domain-containing protein [Arthrobacter zhaoguopingii]